MDTLYFATGNEHKVREARQILDIPIEQIQVDLEEPQTLDLEEIIRQKALQAHRKTQLPVIVEDTGLEFTAWNGLPGALIKWFLSTVGNEGLLKMLSSYDDRRATAVTAVGFCDGSTLLVGRGEISGVIATECRGANGFGWDRIFIPQGYQETFAEMGADVKNQLSMRRKAFEQLRTKLPNLD